MIIMEYLLNQLYIYFMVSCESSVNIKKKISTIISEECNFNKEGFAKLLVSLIEH